MRFIYRTVNRTMQEMEDDRQFFNLKALKAAAEKSSEATITQQARDSASGAQSVPTDIKANCQYELIQGYCVFRPIVNGHSGRT
jgi:hypothetical protein